MPRSLTLDAPAKVNLFLEVLGRRRDGYHEIRTVLQPISLRDRLTFRARRSGIGIEGDTAELGRNNLIMRAAKLIERRAGRPIGVSVTVRKRIPAGAGLGGGSSDAAATLLAMDRLHRLDLGDDVLEKLAARLGSDIPFFIRGRTALCTGRGERVTAVVSPVRLHYVLVMPDVPLETPRVYKRLKLALTPHRRDAIGFVRIWAAGDPKRIGGALFNRLEKPAFEIAPILRKLKRQLKMMKPLGVLMSGSGSALFALCRNADQARNIASRLRKRGVKRVRTARSDENGARIV